MVMATQNPIEQEGTYPLPEAQVDRFMLKVIVDYPSKGEERAILDRMTSGTVFEVEPVISADNTLIELILAPAFSEFEGMINYGSPITTNQGGQQIVLTENLILQPVFRVIQMNTTVSIWNNSTIVLGGMLSDEISTIEDKTALFGDLPFLGGMFRSKAKEQRRRAILLFVSVKVIDPGGQPIGVGSAL